MSTPQARPASVPDGSRILTCPSCDGRWLVIRAVLNDDDGGFWRPASWRPVAWLPLATCDLCGTQMLIPDAEAK